MKTPTQPHVADPAYAALCRERDVLQTAFGKTSLAPLAEAFAEAEAAWMHDVGSYAAVRAAEDALYAAAPEDPAAAWLFIRLCNINLQLSQHRLALGLALAGL